MASIVSAAEARGYACKGGLSQRGKAVQAGCSNAAVRCTGKWAADRELGDLQEPGCGAHINIECEPQTHERRLNRLRNSESASVETLVQQPACYAVSLMHRADVAAFTLRMTRVPYSFPRFTLLRARTRGLNQRLCASCDGKRCWTARRPLQNQTKDRLLTRRTGEPKRRPR